MADKSDSMQHLSYDQNLKTTIEAKEIYPFINWVLSTFIAIIFTVWTFAPESALTDYCQDWMLPDRYYIVSIGYWIIVTIIYYHVLL